MPVHTRTCSGGLFGAGASVMRVFRPVMGGLGWLLAFSVAINLLALALPLHMMAVYDRVLPSRSVETLLYITLIVVAALVVLGAAEGLRLMLCHRLGARLVAEHGAPTFRDALDASADDGGRAAAPRELAHVQGLVASRTFAVLFDLPFVPFFVLIMFVLHPLLGAATMVGIAALALVAWGQFALSRSRADEAERARNLWRGFAGDAVAERDDARALGMRGALAGRWSEHARRALVSADALARIAAASLGLTRTLRQAMQVVVLSLGAWLVIADQLSAGIIFGASIIFGRAVAPVEQVIGSLDRLLAARRDARALSARLAARADEAAEADIVVPHRPLGRVELVAAGLRGEAARDGTVVCDVSFTLEPAKILALIGPTGAGKSQIARLVAGAVAPSEGRVLIDGHDPCGWDDARRTAAIGYVAEDAPLFPGTVADNIARFAPAVDGDRVLWAARFADAHETILRMPDGYATRVAGPFALSTGERQLVALARALYARPRILVLDEPNAFLDQHGEAHFLRALTNARHEGMSSVVVSQRRSVLQVADYIATVNNGRLASFEANRGQWKRRAADERRRTAIHESAREEARRANSAVVLADRLSRELGVDVRPS